MITVGRVTVNASQVARQPDMFYIASRLGCNRVCSTVKIAPTDETPRSDGPLTAIRGGTVVTPGGAQAADLLIRGERIAAVGSEGTDADAVIDARGLVVLPGGLDPHVHLGDLGIAHRETIAHGTAAALLGGITSLFEHPLSVPATTTAARYAAKRVLAERDSRLDIGLWGAIVPGELDEIPGQWRAGARGFKAFVVDSGGIFPRSDDDTLLEGMRRVAALGGLVLVHCESNAIVAGETRRIRAAEAATDARTPSRVHRSPRPRPPHGSCTSRAPRARVSRSSTCPTRTRPPPMATP